MSNFQPCKQVKIKPLQFKWQILGGTFKTTLKCVW